MPVPEVARGRYYPAKARAPEGRPCDAIIKNSDEPASRPDRGPRDSDILTHRLPLVMVQGQYGLNGGVVLTRQRRPHSGDLPCINLHCRAIWAGELDQILTALCRFQGLGDA